MATTIPGFPPNLETAIIGVLTDHSTWASVPDTPSEPQHSECDCGMTIAVGGQFAPPLFAAHQAALVLEVIAQHTTTERAISYQGDPTPHPVAGEKRALKYQAESAAAGLRDMILARMVLPWRAVKNEHHEKA